MIWYLLVGNVLTSMSDSFFSTSNLDDLVKGIKMIAALMDDQDNSKKLIESAKALAQAFNDLLNSLNPNNEDKVILKLFQSSSQ